MFMAYISNFLSLPFYPAGLAIVFLAAGLVALARRRRGAAFLLVLFAGLELYAFSSGPVSYFMVRSLEKRFAPSDTFPSVSAIVLLTGAEVPRMPPRIHDEINEAGNRLLEAARLVRRGAAPRLVITGGNLQFLRTTRTTQAEAAANLLCELFGVDPSMILLEKSARNTYENGLYTRRLFDSLHIPPSIILVTSAGHMYRSVAVFRKLGFTVHPAPAGFSADVPYQWKAISFFPSAAMLHSSSAALHEWYGLAAYKVLGRL